MLLQGDGVKSLQVIKGTLLIFPLTNCIRKAALLSQQDLGLFLVVPKALLLRSLIQFAKL